MTLDGNAFDGVLKPSYYNLVVRLVTTSYLVTRFFETIY